MSHLQMPHVHGSDLLQWYHDHHEKKLHFILHVLHVLRHNLSAACQVCNIVDFMHEMAGITDMRLKSQSTIRYKPHGPTVQLT